MTHSESVGELFAALAAAQSSMGGAKKDAVGQVGKSKVKYADLASYWASCREHLGRHGLAVTQPASSDGRSVTVTTMLGHASGQWVAEALTILCDAEDVRDIGKAITYARRYGLAALVGIAPEDDDAGESGRDWRSAYKSAPEAEAAPGLERLAELRQAMFDRVAPTDPEAAWAAILARRGVKSARDLDPAGLAELTESLEARVREYDADDPFRGLAADGLPAPAVELAYASRR